MGLTKKLSVASLLLLVVAATAIASPLATDGPVAETYYESAFADYTRDTDAEAGDWKAANDRVGEIGGWRSYMNEARQAASAKAGKSKPGNTLPATSHDQPDMSIPAGESASQGAKR